MIELDNMLSRLFQKSLRLCNSKNSTMKKMQKHIEN